MPSSSLIGRHSPAAVTGGENERQLRHDVLPWKRVRRYLYAERAGAGKLPHEQKSPEIIAETCVSPHQNFGGIGGGISCPADNKIKVYQFIITQQPVLLLYHTFDGPEAPETSTFSKRMAVFRDMFRRRRSRPAAAATSLTKPG